MQVFNIPGLYMPSRLAKEIRAAGIDCLGITASTNAAGAVTEVQVVCGDTATLPQVTAVTSVHDPTGPETAAANLAATQSANAATIKANLQNQMAQALTLADLIDANTATPAQQRAAISGCLHGIVRLARAVYQLYDVSA